MADKELRRMSRTELIEIIYALQQEEQSLQQENNDLKDQLKDRRICMDNAGSIAEAALDLNHIFEDAQSAADQYILSIKEIQENTEASKDEEIQIAQKKAKRIVALAQKQAKQIRQEGEQDVADEKEKFRLSVKRLFEQNPELETAYRKRAKREDNG